MSLIEKTPHPQSWLIPARAPVLALALILTILVPVWSRSARLPLGAYDQDFYLGIAHDLLASGRFTDGFAYGGGDPSGSRPPGMRFVPLYPFMLAGAALIEPEFRTGLDCVAEHYATYAACPNTARAVRGAQFAMLAGVYLMVWRLAGAITGSARGGWIGLGLALMTAPTLMRSADLVMTEMTSLFLSTAATCAAVAAARASRPWRWAAAAGLLLGLLTLTRPAFLYLVPAILLVWLPAGIAAMRGHGLGKTWREQAVAMAVFAAAFAVPVGPWVLRNAAVLGRPGLSFGYASHTLVQRISYDSMTWHEYGLSYLCGLPDGRGITEKLSGAGACDRFALDEKPGTFYAIGIGPLLTQTLEAAGGYENHLRYLIHAYILPHLAWHMLVTIPLALRGAWIDHYWGIVLGLACLALTIRALYRLGRKDWRETGFLVLALPGWFMLAFNGAVAVNQVRYNLMLVVAYAVSGALLAEFFLRRRRRVRLVDRV